MVELPVYAYIVIGLIAVAGIVWGFVSNAKNKKAKNAPKSSEFSNN